jgi:CheY-like chemotaxis protein
LKILFVDDRPVTHAYFREQLQKDSRFNKNTIELAFDLRGAIDLLNQDIGQFVAVVIDLHLPNSDIPSELKLYNQQYGREIQLNEGQLLGMYLRDKNIPYFYLSAYTTKYRKDWESNPTPACLDKEVSAEKFIETLAQLPIINRDEP